MTRELALANGVIYQARPAIETDGRREAMVQELLLAMEMEESEGGLSSLELRFVNSAQLAQSGIDFAFEYSDVDALSLGKSVRVLAGNEDDPQEIFSGVISALELMMSRERQPELVVLAEDALQKARMARRTRVHQAAALRDLVETIASDLGLQARIEGLSANVDVQMQLNESDLAFLRRVLGRYDVDLQIVGNELQVSPRSEVRRSEVTLEFNSQLKSLRAVADLAHQTSKVTFSGWDVSQGQAITVETESTADLGPGTGRTGAQILADALAERAEHIGNAAVTNESEAQALVSACFSQRARRFVRVAGIAEGNPALRVGAHVTLQGVGPRFENTYYVTKTRHRYDLSNGYQTEFEAECGYFGG